MMRTANAPVRAPMPEFFFPSIGFVSGYANDAALRTYLARLFGPVLSEYDVVDR